MIAVVGPTAVGKTKISIDLARRLHTEIISGDSMLVYRDFNIGTAKPDSNEQAGVLHHLIDILEPDAEFSVAEFQHLAGQLITRINMERKLPILAGGTGLYVRALLEGYDFQSPPANQSMRDELQQLAAQYGNEFIHAKLAEADPDKAARLHPNDVRRIIRALEVHLLSDSDSSLQKKDNGGQVYDSLVIGLTMDRQALYERIDKRVDCMIADGLIQEVSLLLNKGVSPSSQAMQGIGYKEVNEYLAGKISLEQTINTIKQSTRRFAKRQLTWYRKMPYIRWVNVDEFTDHNLLMEYIYNLVAEKFGIE